MELRTRQHEEAAKPPRLLTTEDVAAVLKVAPATVVWWRSQKQGPPWIFGARQARSYPVPA